MNIPSSTSDTTRRRFLHDALGVGACVGLGTLAGSGDAIASPPIRVDAVPGALLDVAGAGMPYRQDDPAWANDVMWNRDLVIRVDTKFNGHSQADAKALLWKYDDGNTISNEGCLLTCLAMVLRLLAPPCRPVWNPKTLNATAQELHYYTRAGLSMTVLYADLVSEITDGKVQLCIKEEYPAGMRPWPRMHANTSALVRAYRSLPPAQRSNFLLMLKTGTYDDTVASHYVLLHPNDSRSLESNDPEILDPAKPLKVTRPWHLSDSAKHICTDRDIAREWSKHGIAPTQIGGAWVFTRWQNTRSRSLAAPLIAAWSTEIMAQHGK